MACRISMATKFFGLEVILLEDPATRATFLYNELDQLDISFWGLTMISNKVGQHNIQVQENTRRGASSRPWRHAHIQVNDQDLAIEAKEVKKDDEKEEPS